jgi:indolepyruvate ferredoxin oxidoreductase
MMTAMKVLARMKGLRGTAFDIFGRSEERRMERKLIEDYRRMISDISTRLTPANHRSALLLARLPEQIRGFGHVKAASVAAAELRRAALLKDMVSDTIVSRAAE